MLVFNEKTDLSKTNSYYESATNDTRSESIEKCKEIKVINPNTCSVFLADNSLDVDALLKEGTVLVGYRILKRYGLVYRICVSNAFAVQFDK